MIKDKKRLLIVDDSEIDREVLKIILSDDFEIMEAENGYAALEIIMKKKIHFDAMILDVSMPVLDGFSVLQFLKENNVNNIPVFLITAEATKDNVERAVQYNISEFIGKPFEKDEILKRLKSKLGVITKHDLNEADIAEIKKYIADLESLYNRYLANSGDDVEHYERMTELMKILLNRYSAISKGVELDESQIEIISKAAYFCDIGNMLIGNNVKYRTTKLDDTVNDVYQSHTLLGADIIRLNYSKNCEYFVQICADMCLHHHEKYDGTGFPHRLFGGNISIYTQMCRLVDEFDSLFFKYREHNELQYEYVIRELTQNKKVSEEVLSLLTDSKSEIIAFYKENITQ